MFDFENKWLTRIVSFLIALVLFFFVTYENNTTFRSNNSNNGASVISSEVVPNVPIEVNVDTEQYFVTGIPDGVTLRLEGPQAVLLQTSITQNFSVVTPNLNELGPGSHKVTLEVKGLSKELSASVSPAQITVKIEEKKEKDFPIEVEITDDLNLADGYKLGKPVLSEEFVTLSGASSTLEQVATVKAIVESNIPSIDKDMVVSAGLVVLDHEGNPLNVNLSSVNVQVRIPVSEDESQKESEKTTEEE